MFFLSFKIQRHCVRIEKPNESDIRCTNSSEGRLGGQTSIWPDKRRPILTGEESAACYYANHSLFVGDVTLQSPAYAVAHGRSTRNKEFRAGFAQLDQIKWAPDAGPLLAAALRFCLRRPLRKFLRISSPSRRIQLFVQ